MTLREEIKRERKKFLATATPKEKWNYFCDYYGLLTVVCIIIAFLVTWVVVDTVTRPEVLLNGTFINVPSDRAQYSDELGDNFLKTQKIDTEKYTASFGTGLTLLNGDMVSSYESSQALMTQAAAGALDIIGGPNKQLLDYAYSGLFTDLRTVLTEEELEAYKPYLHYIDEAVVEERQELEDKMESYADIKLPDTQNPDAMKKPIPMFIDMGGNEKMGPVYGNTSDLIVGVSVNYPNKDMTRKFLQYLLQE